MSNPKELYYSESSSRVRYTSKPSRRIDFKRAIAGKSDCFVSGVSARVPKQKKLILADWTMRNWDEQKLVLAQKRLQELMADGFSLYLWHLGEVKPLTDLNCLTEPEIFAFITPEFPEKIIKTAVAQQKITKANAFVLDKDWFEWLLHSDTASIPGPKRNLKVSDLLSLSDTNAELVLDIFKKTNLTFNTLIYDELSERTITEPPILKKVNAQSKAFAYETLYFDGLEVISAVSLHPQQYIQPCLKSLTIQQNVDVKKLLSLVNSDILSGIENLKITGYQEITGAFSSLEKGSLSRLKTIDLSSAEFTADDLSALLNAAPNLEDIRLSSCELTKVFSSLERGSLGKLNNFHLFKGNITAKEFVALQTIAPNLESINLSHCENLARVFSSLEKGSLSKLKMFYINHNNISTKDISALFLAAPNLESLSLTGCDQLDDSFTSLKVGSLSKLKWVDLEESKIIAANLSLLCSAAPNIEKLYLSGCKQIAGGFICLEDGSLSKLKTVIYTSSGILYSDLVGLCFAAPNLEEIDLSDCTQIAGGFSALGKVMLSKLKKADLTGSNLTPKDINGLKAAAVNLSDLKLPVPPPVSQKTVNKVSRSSTLPRKLDPDTKEDPNKTLTATRIFCTTEGEPLPVEHYRLALFNKLRVNKNFCSLEDAFEMSLEGDLGLTICDAKRSLIDVFELGKTIEKTEGYSYAYGTQTFELYEEWQAIPSLKASEELLHYHTNPSTAEIEIQYSKQHNRYYIRSLGQKQSISLDFLLKVPPPANNLPDEIQRLVDKFNSYKSGELKLDPTKTQYNGEDYLNYVVDKACRHRAFAFGHLLQEQYPQFPMRVVTNDAHAFVEVNIGNQWINCDLGGYAAKLDIKEMTKPTPLAGSKFDAKLQPWRIEKPPAESLEAYLQTLVKPSAKKNRLVKLESEKSVTALIGSLQKHCQDSNRPVFYIHSPEEASGLAHYIERKGNIGTMTKGAGSPFAAFLTADYPADVSPVLVVNYSRFNADDIVRLNTMLDPKRSVEDFKIPDSFILVGVNNTNDPDCYQGSDFYSRFDKNDSNPVSNNALTEVLSEFPKRLTEKAPDNVINLFHANDWKFRLLGGWVLGEGNLVFKKGLLQSALKKGKQLTIENGLWDDPEFVFFWQQACLTGRILGEDGTVFDTRDLKIDTLEGYDWNFLKNGWQINPNFEGEELILNFETLNDYFEGYEITANKRAKPSLGFIQNAADLGQEVLNVYVSHNLSDDDWAMLLSECHNKKLRLSLRCAPGVRLPGELPNDLQPQVFGWKPSIQDHTQFIESSDIDTTVAMLSKVKQWEVIDISECSASDLLLDTKPEFKDDHFEFTETERALLVALKAGKSVILKGNFSEELSCALTPLLFSRFKGKNLKSELVLVSNSNENFEYLPNLYAHKVSVEDKQALVKTNNPLIDWSKPLSNIQAELQFPGSSEGLLTLENSIQPLPAYRPEKSTQQTEEFNQQRKELIWSVLSKSPYVYIAGLTGVGKSTFIKNEFLKNIPHKLYRGEQDMEAWARDNSDQLKVIFIDEANLSAKQWSEFEGLFNIPPTILINGELIPLTPQHKIIFAGNPLSYGDERQLAPFFTRHQRVVIFDPLPPTVIYEQILKPVLATMHQKFVSLCWMFMHFCTDYPRKMS